MIIAGDIDAVRQKYMLELIDTRRAAEKRVVRYDLFSSLLDANDEDGGEGDVKLTTQELLGNIFIFQLAGHEVRSTLFALRRFE